jgi:hypothetical protein
MPFKSIELRHEGFWLLATFIDLYGHRCSIQTSSGAEYTGCWLGRDDGDGNVCRMHLTQELAMDLIPLLQSFALTGHLALPIPGREQAFAREYAENIPLPIRSPTYQDIVDRTKQTPPTEGNL